MEGEWPLVGRAAELERVDRLLRDRSAGVVLAGAAGVGKTRLAGRCLALAADRGFVPIRVAATQAACALPLGAYAPLLPDLAPGADRIEVLRKVGRAILEKGEGSPVAVLVDDAHLLDDTSAALTHQLAARDDTFVIATVRSGEPASDAVVALWKDGVTERVELAPLELSDVEELLMAVLKGAVDGSAVRRLWERTEGNGLFLKEAVLGALDAGILRHDRGLWRLEGRLPATHRLVELVEARLAGLDDAHRDTLALVGIAEPLGVDLFPAAGESITALERRGLVRVDADGRRLQVRLAHPLYGDVLRSRLSPLSLRKLSRSLADAVEAAGARRREDLLRVASWRLDSGGGIEPATMVAAGRQARVLFDFQLAERLVRAGIDAGAGFDAELFLAELLSLQGRCQDAEDLLVALTPRAHDDRDRTRLTLRRIDNLTLAGRGDALISVLEEAEATVTDPAWVDRLTVERALLAWYSGRTAVAGELVEPMLDRLKGQTLIAACFIAAYTFGLSGRSTAALDACERALGAHRYRDFPRLMLYPSIHRSMQCRVLVWAGRLAEAEELAVRCYREALREEAMEPQSWFAQFLSECLQAQGRSETAIRWARESVGILRSLARLGYLRNFLIGLAHPLVSVGRVSEAEDVLAEAEALTRPEFRFQYAELIRARAWVAVAKADLASGKQLLEEAAAVAADGGDLVYESAALHDLARLGRAKDVTGRLSQLAAVLEGPLASVRAAHAAGIVAGDAVALEAVSVAFEGMPAFLLAAEAAADAAVAWRKAGDPRRAAASERRAGDLADRCEAAPTPALTGVSARAILSARELEIARLAAKGVSNKEIAARLYLSLHTVQNKLHSAYEKLGVRGRAELAEALEGL